MEKVVIVGMARTPIGNFLGGLKDVNGVELGIIASMEALKRAKIDKSDITSVVGSFINKSGMKGNPARQVQLGCGLPYSGYAVSIDQQCSSGIRAFEIASNEIMLDKVQAALVVGAESMSNIPHLAMGLRKGKKMGDMKLVDALYHDGLIDAMEGIIMGITAENIAVQYDITREEADNYAVESYKRAVKAVEEGKFKKEIVPVNIERNGKTITVYKDERPRSFTLDELKNASPYFKENGTVTAFNASGLNDGAAAMVLCSESYALKNNLTILGEYVDSVSYGVEPKVMGIGPVPAIRKLLSDNKISINDVDYFEINEAFSTQALYCIRELGIDSEKVNINGSGVSLGHPVSMTGVRIIMEVLYELETQNKKTGIASLCAGGGPAIAALIKRRK